MTPKMVMHPTKLELDGKDLTNNQDSNGKRLFVEMVKTCKKEGAGFVDFYWPKPGEPKAVPNSPFGFKELGSLFFYFAKVYE